MKWQLCAVTLIGLIVIGLMAPRETQERAPRAAQVSVSVLPAILGTDGDADTRPAAVNARERYESEISDSEAVEIALRRGDEIAEARAAGSNPRLRETEAEVITASVAAPEPTPEVTRTENAVTSPDVTPIVSAEPEPAPEPAAAEAPSIETAVAEAVQTAPAVEESTPEVAATETTELASAAPAPLIWRVTADRVNLRGGPSTDEPIVGRVSAGDALVPVSGLGTEWIQVERPSGETAWIFAEFLAQQTEG